MAKQSRYFMRLFLRGFMVCLENALKIIIHLCASKMFIIEFMHS